MSGEVAARRVLREPVAARELARAPTVSAGSSVFLTFDDGPDPSYTVQILDVLKAQGVKATFCIVGRCADSITAAARLGWPVLGWNVDPSDYTRPGTEVIITRVASAARPGSIVLFHDGGGDRSQTAAALPAIIGALRTAGYSFGAP